MTCKHARGDLFREIKLGWALQDGLMFSFAWPGRVNQEIWFAVTVERGGGAQPFISNIHHIYQWTGRHARTKSKTTEIQHSCIFTYCYNCPFKSETAAQQSAAPTKLPPRKVGSVCTHLIDAANQAHTPKSMPLTNNLHQQCTTTHTSKRSTILQPTGPKESTAGHQRSLKEDVWQCVNRCTTNRSKPL